MMTLNAKIENDDGSECQNWEAMMALNVETEKRWWLWMPNLRSDDGFEHQNWEAMTALNAKLGSDGGSERQNWEAIMTLNARIEKR